ncbi:MAG: flagellar brake protein [Gammaproteobacteria bacterium]|nr:flagellar brake protein [Gammaproteobacteria bacterium]MDH5652259.1 flagellar brake protein [Gammaproteobacteria bacterium]
MEKIDLNIGALLNMQLLSGEGKQRYEVKLIGMLPGESLLVSMPRINGILPKIFPHDEYIVRHFAGKNIIAFKTSVLMVCQIPYHYIHLKYPETLESVTVRQSERIDVHVTTQVSIQDKKILGTIRDISATGAMILMPEKSTTLDEHVELFFDLTMGNIERSIHLVAIVRNIRDSTENNGAKCCRYGVEFIDPSEADVVFVYGYVYEQLLKKRDGGV